MASRNTCRNIPHTSLRPDPDDDGHEKRGDGVEGGIDDEAEESHIWEEGDQNKSTKEAKIETKTEVTSKSVNKTQPIESRGKADATGSVKKVEATTSSVKKADA